MKQPVVTLKKILYPLKSYFLKDAFNRIDISNAPPLRAELFTQDQFAAHATALARTYQLTRKKTPEYLLKRLANNEEVLLQVLGLLQEAVHSKIPVSPAGEWLLDNYYLIEEQIQLGIKHLPKGYSNGLPMLDASGEAYRKLPRVYALATEIIVHSDGHLDIPTLSRFLRAYQDESDLSLGELWAFPIMLRLALIENLRRVAARIAIDRIDANDAHQWANKIIRAAEENPKDLVLTMADMARSGPPMVSAFVAEYCRKLQWKGVNLMLPLTWVEQHLAEQGDTINGMVVAENQQQAANHVSVSNSIKSLRFLTKTDWREFVEGLSSVEQTLCNDPGSGYKNMDFATRDQYRHAIEYFAKKTRQSEKAVAQKVIALTRQPATIDPRASHVGFYLIDEGRRITEHSLNVRFSLWEHITRLISNHPQFFYAALALLMTGVLSAYWMVNGIAENSPMGVVVAMRMTSILGASQMAIALGNWIATLRKGPTALPKMDFSVTIPDEARTLVIIPTLLSDTKQVEELLEGLEVRFLGNREPNLLFGLLTDFTDATEQNMPDDNALVALASHGIQILNKKYKSDNHSCFFLFHRPRRWNATDRKWMGYERKRGKLNDLNELLRGGSGKSFSVLVGDPADYANIRYVITLDTDTQLPREAARKMVGAMAHPLNHPYYDEQKKRIVHGYGIIQPRIAISLHGATRSRYTRLHENDAGIDPYTRFTSDVYQDVFGEGSFIGKGIYDIKAFHKVLYNRFPENRILSHDLLEGCYLRSGFASDIQLYEEWPSHYQEDTVRRARWIRGDWQIWNWILPFVPDITGHLTHNPLHTLSRWKILDNLRRSLIPPALLLLLLTGWFFTPNPMFWTLVALAVVLMPPLIITGSQLVRKPVEVALSRHLENVFENMMRSFLQGLFQITCIPYEAHLHLAAIGRTMNNMFVTRRNLLTWNVSSRHYRPGSAANIFIEMIAGPFVALIITILMVWYTPQVLPISLPFIILWAAAPGIIYWTGLTLAPFTTPITSLQHQQLRLLARKTWSFFESLVTAEENWLPPDNLQQYPVVHLAHRTSPTNIGLSLLSTLAAYDLGYHSGNRLVQSTERTFQSLTKLERYEGHFFNWYNTLTLDVMHPRYVSTVDSGNLAGHLLTLKQGLIELKSAPVFRSQWLHGLEDTLAAASSMANEGNIFNTLQQEVSKALSDDLSFGQTRELLLHFQSILNPSLLPKGEPGSRYAPDWRTTLINQVSDWLDEGKLLLPIELLQSVPMVFKGFLHVPQNASLLDMNRLNEQLRQLRHTMPKEISKADDQWLTEFQGATDYSCAVAIERLNHIDFLLTACEGFAEMEYRFLYDPNQHLMSIGYNADDHRLDTGYYDLLASEARLGLFVAIAQGKLPQESWFALGRRLTETDSTAVLLSWSGSMFEYLMPRLIMPTYTNTLLDDTYLGCLKKQIAYGRRNNVPWGISESCYNMVDANLTYQYRAFGVPELGFKRGLGFDLVIAPYASVMALMVDPEAACKNLDRLRMKGYEGMYGFYESIDYSPLRMSHPDSPALIRTFMAHHQGMSLLSLDYLLCQQPMQKRFAASPDLQTALLLLQERIPAISGFYTNLEPAEEIIHTPSTANVRLIRTHTTPEPEIQLLSNGQYHVMVSNAGGGYSRYQDLAITRWREDATRDHWGSFCYVRDLDDGSFWSNTYQPTLQEAETYEAIFSHGRAEFRRVDHGIEVHTEIIVSPEDQVEIRRITVVNRSAETRSLELTSYGEVVIALASADQAHTAFGNLFVQTSILPEQQTILCTRRARSHDEQPPWMMHMIKVNGEIITPMAYETDRAAFIGRGSTLVRPAAMTEDRSLTDSSGSVLDPIFSIQARFIIAPNKSVVADLVTGIANTKSACQYLVDKYQDLSFRNRAFELTWTHGQVVLRQINANETDAQLFTQMASAILYTNATVRAPQDILLKNTRGQSALWSFSLSGDLPIVLAHVTDSAHVALIKQLMQARSYWLFKGLVIDMVIIIEDQSGYPQVLQEQVQSLIAVGVGINPQAKQGTIVVRLIDQITNEDRILLQTAARIVVSDKLGSLSDQLNRKPSYRPFIPLLVRHHRNPISSPKRKTNEILLFENGIGGFNATGTEYIIHENRVPPAPWCNILANPNFGTLVSEAGPVYTWAENAHSFRLTPWNNDSVTNNSGEAFFLRDEESGAIWSPMGYPSNPVSGNRTRHGFGYSQFDLVYDEIDTETCIYVDAVEPVKYTRFRITNNSGHTRVLSLTAYAEWVLGTLRQTGVMHIVTSYDPDMGVLITRNPFNTDFPNRIAFLQVDQPMSSFTTDRREFIGRNGNLSQPEGLNRLRLSGREGAGVDPCSAIQVPFTLAPGQTIELVISMGAAANLIEGHALIRRVRGREAAATALTKVREWWRHTLGQIQIQTPEASVNILANGWLMYQVIACRLWGRTGFYQSGGAFGFRDQLQDVLAVMHTTPQLTREQILLAASRQFPEGDVQHWWHPPTGRGVRTLCSDDLLWLVYTTERYILETQDTSILQEVISFVESEPLPPGQESRYELPDSSGLKSTLYDHCKRAVQHAARYGGHGLPLMGSGDWNDGMNNVGIEGRGESVWLGFLLYDVATRFAALASNMKDESFAQSCILIADQLKVNLNDHAWDGGWYRRAYFDDGTALGTASASECRIDSVSQSWSVLSGAGMPDRIKQAMQSAEEWLVDKDHQLIRLLTPPFDKMAEEPGYIKGYLPGIRENGGQYTHGAIWMVMALAKLEHAEKAFKLLQLINPILHSTTQDGCDTYRVEPYVMAADVYGSAPHSGRGGWTWYTGSAGWMYQLIIGSFLGIHREGDRLTIAPCLPMLWQSCSIDYRFGTTPYKIILEPTSSQPSLLLDGIVQPGGFIHLVDDQGKHLIVGQYTKNE
jgi:cellobiose phosphorylase